LSAIVAAPNVSSALAVFLALLNACTLNLSQEQAAFFLTLKKFERNDIDPTYGALVGAMKVVLTIPRIHWLHWKKL